MDLTRIVLVLIEIMGVSTGNGKQMMAHNGRCNTNPQNLFFIRELFKSSKVAKWIRNSFLL